MHISKCNKKFQFRNVIIIKKKIIRCSQSKFTLKLFALLFKEFKKFLNLYSCKLIRKHTGETSEVTRNFSKHKKISVEE